MWTGDVSTIRGSVSDADTPVEDLRITLDVADEPAWEGTADPDGAFELTTVLPGGTVALVLTVTDPDGNDDQFVRTATTGTETPMCAILSPEDGATLPSDEAVYIQAEAFDLDDALEDLEFFWYLDGAAMLRGPDWSSLTVEPGEHVLSLKVVDPDGNTCTARATFTL